MIEINLEVAKTATYALFLTKANVLIKTPFTNEILACQQSLKPRSDKCIREPVHEPIEQ